MPSEKIWIGERYPDQRIFVLGESWYGEYSDDLVTDDGWIRAYLEGRVTDATYTRIANACGAERRQFWQGVMFTNFVQCVGLARSCRPTEAMYDSAQHRLSQIIEEHRPRGVWVLGKEQSRYSVPVIERAGVVAEVSAHPASYGLKNAALGESWARLRERVAAA